MYKNTLKRMYYNKWFHIQSSKNQQYYLHRYECFINTLLVESCLQCNVETKINDSAKYYAVMHTF